MSIHNKDNGAETGQKREIVKPIFFNAVAHHSQITSLSTESIDQWTVRSYNEQMAAYQAILAQEALKDTVSDPEERRMNAAGFAAGQAIQTMSGQEGYASV